MLKKLFSFLMLAAVVGLFLWAGDALAQPADPTYSTGVGDTAGSGKIWTLTFGKTLTTFLNVRTTIFIIGGFGLVALAFFAIFGKIQWKWFAALCVGLAIVAAAGYIVEYATGAGAGSTQSTGSGLGSTFQGS